MQSGCPWRANYSLGDPCTVSSRPKVRAFEISDHCNLSCCSFLSWPCTGEWLLNSGDLDIENIYPWLFGKDLRFTTSKIDVCRVCILELFHTLRKYPIHYVASHWDLVKSFDCIQCECVNVIHFQDMRAVIWCKIYEKKIIWVTSKCRNHWQVCGWMLYQQQCWMIHHSCCDHYFTYYFPYFPWCCFVDESAGALWAAALLYWRLWEYSCQTPSWILG